MRRFFIREKPVDGTAHIDGAEARHIRTVLRLEPGDNVVLFHGSGCEYVGCIKQVTRDGVDVRIVSRADRDPTLSTHLIVACSVVKPKAMDMLVQKCTELGVAELWPCITQRTSVNVSSGDVLKVEKWRKVSIEAAKQCGRNTLPEIRAPMSFEGMLHTSGAEQFKVVLSVSRPAESLRNVIGEKMPDRMLILIGPEGGLSEDEERETHAAGFVSASIGPFTLRTETAAIAVASAVLFRCC